MPGNMPTEPLQPDIKLAAALFDTLDRATRRGRGIVRDSYGDGEQAAHDIMRAAARITSASKSRSMPSAT